MTDARITRAELVRASGVSGKTIDAYVAGAPIVRADKLRDLSRGLGWTTDSIDRIRAGGEPALATQTQAPPDALQDGHGGTEGWPVWLEAKFSRLERRVEQLEQIAARWEALLFPDETPPGRGAQ
jgi:hypothetical protein